MATAEEILEYSIATCSRDVGARVKITGFPGEITVSATELHLARRCAAAEACAARYREALEAVCDGVLMRSDGTLHSTRWAEIARTALADEEPRDGE